MNYITYEINSFLFISPKFASSNVIKRKTEDTGEEEDDEDDEEVVYTATANGDSKPNTGLNNQVKINIDSRLTNNRSRGNSSFLMSGENGDANSSKHLRRMHFIKQDDDHYETKFIRFYKFLLLNLSFLIYVRTIFLKYFAYSM